MKKLLWVVVLMAAGCQPKNEQKLAPKAAAEPVQESRWNRHEMTDIESEGREVMFIDSSALPGHGYIGIDCVQGRLKSWSINTGTRVEGYVGQALLTLDNEPPAPFQFIAVSDTLFPHRPRLGPTDTKMLQKLLAASHARFEFKGIAHVIRDFDVSGMNMRQFQSDCSF